ncbi:MAG: hypothetical protein ACI8ZB_005271 [Desulforhopalus sp.]|jgi:hypothetical protein
MDSYNTLFATDQDCISYLFHKRWPTGFCCPFCNRHQKEIAPAHTVVCRYCRKQSSITANTLMHGSKKSLAEWMQVAAQFCFSTKGISARSLQNSFQIATYQTAWNWLKKMRKAAAIAESARLNGPVHIIATTTGNNNKSSYKYISRIACLMDTPKHTNQQGRIRLRSFPDTSATTLPDFILQAVTRGASITGSKSILRKLTTIEHVYQLHITNSENEDATALFNELQQWMSFLYRGATDPKYLQDYLDEFCFRHNTATWNNRLAILDHLLTGIMVAETVPPQHTPATTPGGA